MKTLASASHAVRLTVVICTKDRPAELAACLDSLAQQTRLPAELVVVDAGSAPVDTLLATFASKVQGCATRLIHTTPGLTAQRNLGARVSSGDVVLFLDDDVVLEPAYITSLATVYERDTTQHVGGVGGKLVPDPTPRESRWRRALRMVFLLPGWGRGRIKRSGHPEYLLSTEVERPVEFLSGCNMSFRRDVVQALSFDERLHGYAAGEDIQFSYRASRRWTLIVTPAARLDHRENGGGRPDDTRRIEMGVVNHFLFFREQVARTGADWACYVWACLGTLLFAVGHPGRGRLAGLLRGYRVVIRLALKAASRAHDETTTATAPTIQHKPDTPFVSVIVPARNEERSLEHCLASLVEQSYPRERLDVVVVENRSTDRTREVAERWAERHSQVRVLVSDAVNQAAAMNAGLQLAKGDVIARVDAHSWIDEHYVRNAVDALARHPEAACVGGPFLPVGTGLLERVSGLARSSRLGVGSGYGSDRRTDDHPVQTVQCGVFRRNALEAVGGFDVAMAYGEDEDLNWRLLKCGHAIILCPSLRQFYRPRPNLYALARQYWNYGQGRLRVVLKHPDFLRVKHLAPSALVTALVSFAFLAAFAPFAQRVLVGLLSCYGVALGGAALLAAPAGWLAAALLPLAIVSMHFGYGAGMLWGLGRHVFGRLWIHGKLGGAKQCRHTSGSLQNR